MTMVLVTSGPGDKAGQVEALRRQVARIERGARDTATPVLPFGVAGIDRHLPGGGLMRGALHEVSGQGPDAEDAAARLDPAKPVLWCQMGEGDLYGPGLAACGLAPSRLLIARARNAADLLWAM